MIRRLHTLAASVAILTILTFQCATLVAELSLGEPAIATVKHGILYGIFLLIPAIIATGASGFALARGRSHEIVAAKKKRMPIIALNGLLLLVPAAIYLDAKASAAQFDGSFYFVQVVEIVAGLFQLTLMVKSFAQGRRIVDSI